MSFTPKGIIPAMVTPFDEQGGINEAILRELVDYLIEGGVHGLFPVGSQGEFYALEKGEKKKIIEIVLSQAEGKLPVYAGTGAITTKETIILTKMAEDIGVDAVSVITPFFISPTQDELYEHYFSIAKSTHLPVLLYNNPGRTGVNLSVDLVVRLSKISNIVGIKDSSGDMTLISEYIRKTDDDFSVLAGRDTLIYGTLLYGGKGSIAATANVAPKLVVEIYEAFVKGDTEQAKEAQANLAPLRLAFGLGSFPVVIKDALKLIGIDVGSARGPVKSLDKVKQEKLKNILQQMELLEEHA
ncbi:MAG: 4-hydroxy-tetrahydrodipicolinate synthase [Candidatus Aerophobetes bacterium]|nr:4-hydroxy-tetrahydrodipicolinate synthase [Candidatus Aerophobetes bacterium]